MTVQSSEMLGCAAPWRSCLVMEGTDAREVLQSIVSNDVTGVRPGELVYAALLTPQGKYLFDFFLGERADGAVRIEVAADRAEALAKRLKMYCLRRDARVTAEPEAEVALVWTAETRPAGLAHPSPSAAGAEIAPDPRAAALGWRIWSENAGRALKALGASESGRAEYDARRIAHAVPESGVELVPEESFILEAGFERLSGVDFRKGCYVGQEVTARMKHKTELRKGLVRVLIEGQAAPGTPLVTAEGKPAGTLFSQAGREALAHLRFDRASGPLSAGQAHVRWPG